MIRKMEKEFRRIKVPKNLLLFVVGIFILLAGVVIIWVSSLKIPDFHSFEDRKVVNSTKIYDRTGKILLYDIHQDVKRTDIPFEKMSVNIKNATIAIEDSEFYNHGGIKITSIIRAVLSNLLNSTGKTQGGSTITQQLVKNALLTQKKTIARKIKEWVLAIKIDKSIPKEKILEYYLNESPYGGNIYGIEEASKTYFDKDAQDLTLAEAAYLASIPQSPTMLSPYGKNRDKLDARKNLVLSRMLELEFISQEEYNTAQNEVVSFVPQETIGIKAPHFVFFIKDYLEQKYGSELVEKGGLSVVTTLDYDLQEKGEEIVKEGALQNEKDWNGNNAGLVAIDPKTGQILTMVGSRDYFDKAIDGNYNIATAWRQPGSSFKPFIYATAFNKGFTPDTVLFDLPTEFQTTCNAYGKALPGHNQDDCYMPDDYDGKTRGPMSLRNALAQSINIPAVKLFYLAGLSDSLKTSEDMGISTLTDVSRYGLTLVIGGGEVSLLDMTSAYGVFANNGGRNPYTGILEIEDKNGKVLETYFPNTKEVLPKNTALTISDILSDNIARVPTFGSSSALLIPNRNVAVKTGTTNSNRDAWTIGYTPSIVVGVWAGNNDNKPMKKGGSAVAGPIWNKFINETLKTLPNEKFEKPNLEIDPKTVKPIIRGYWQGNENFFIDKISGKLAGEFTPRETTQEKVITNVHSILYWIDRDNILGAPPLNPSENPQFNNWEIPVQDWWTQNRGKYRITTLAEKPTTIDDIHTGTSQPTISIIRPDTVSIYPPDQKIQLQISNFGRFPLKKIDVFINNTFIDTIGTPFNFSFIPEELDSLKPENELRIISYDIAYNRAENVLIFKVKQ
ncbi:MAG: Penicillin-binding protein, 1A family [Candidatus Nomurabacteria bacterium GW2011_GWA1_35_8]|uniref:Penicillin-binding protein, 1A family n=2 Tax=Candidatus Nomuraibacteriota TaxID=1752729 RepID=A0A0G0G2L9_9BACT|nr:MAG: Penicillin-binding protein, 1A family [Candidatus Nomurabacteria bacterium GW2011_GWA1_35_8]